MLPTFRDDNARLSFFFTDPGAPIDHEQNGIRSILYLLRRELIETLGYEPDRDSESYVDQKGPQRRLFASMILMFTAIDLLAKFMCGDEGKVGCRFSRFLQSPHGGAMEKQQAELLYAARNSLVHDFGLPSTDDLKGLNLQSVVFGQRRGANPSEPERMVVEQRGEDAVVYVDGLYHLTIESICRFRKMLARPESDEARAQFSRSFDKYALIRVLEY